MDPPGKATLVRSVQQQLSKILGYDDGGHLAEFLVDFKTEEQLRSYLFSFMGEDLIEDPRVQDLIRSILDGVRKLERRQPATSSSSTHRRLQQELPVPSLADQKGRNIRIVYKKKKRQHQKQDSATEAAREECGCNALRHDPLINCTACGRILCKVEGEGPCFFCGSHVTVDGTIVNPDFAELMGQTSSLAADGDGAAAAEDEPSEEARMRVASGLKAAIAQRDAILNYVAQQERLGSSSRRLIDEQEDFYAFDAFDSPEQRKEKERLQEEMYRKEEEDRQRRRRRINVDLITGLSDFVDPDKVDLEASTSFQTRKIDEGVRQGQAAEDDEEESAYAAAQLAKGVREQQRLLEKDGDLGARYFSNKNLHGRALEVYESLREAVSASKLRPSGGKSGEEKVGKTHQRRVIDTEEVFDQIPSVRTEPIFVGVIGGNGEEEEEKEYAAIKELPDKGICLSMHQPWASLLVHGIKVFEGRGWSTEHRGRLWIASAAKEMDTEVREAVEQQFREVYAPKEVVFPTSYPTGVLLGCVDVVDCLSSEEFKALDTRHQSEADYVLYCKSPRELLVKLPVKGGHKLWHLGGALHRQAQAVLKPPRS